LRIFWCKYRVVSLAEIQAGLDLRETVTFESMFVCVWLYAHVCVVKHLRSNLL